MPVLSIVSLVMDALLNDTNEDSLFYLMALKETYRIPSYEKQPHM